MHLGRPDISTQLITHRGEQRILVKMPYRQDLIAKVKAIPGRKYSKKAQLKLLLLKQENWQLSSGT